MVLLTTKEGCGHEEKLITSNISFLLGGAKIYKTIEYIKTSEYKTRIDVYFDGEKYVFVNAFHGLVAIVRRDEGFPNFSSDGMTAYNSFRVEETRNTISALTIERVICKSESKYMTTSCKFIYDEVNCECLPYSVSVKIDKR